MTKPSDYFKKLDLAHLDANTAQFIREKILTLPNIDVLEGTKEFETIKAIVEESFPRAIGIEPVVIAPVVEEIHEPVIEEVVEPIIDTKQEEIKTISGEIAEMTDLVDLLNEVVAENPQDLDSMDVLELYKETLVELSNKLKSLTEVITEAVSEVKDNIEEVKEVIKTDVVDTKGILTAPKKYKTEDGEEVLGYESDWNFGTKKHLGETVVYYSYKEGISGKYSVLTGILHKGEVIYSEDKISNKEFENKFDSEKEALDFAYEISLDKESVDKYENGGALKTENYSTLVYKTKKSADKSASQIKEYFGDRFIKSEVLKGKDERGDYGYQVRYELKKDKYEKGGSVNEKLTKQKIKAKLYKPSGDFYIEDKGNNYILHFTPSDAAKNNVNLENMYAENVGKGYYGSAYSVKKNIEHKYEKGGSISNTTDSIIPNLLIELWLAVHEKRNDDYGSISEKLDSNKVPFSVQNKVSESATELRYKKAIDVLEVKDIVSKILSDYLNKEAEDILRVGKIETDIRDDKDNTRTIIVEIKPNKEYALIVKKNGDVIKLSKAQNELVLLLNKNKYEKGGSVGLLDMKLEQDMQYLADYSGVTLGNIVEIFNTMIDLGLTDEDLKTPPTKTGTQYQKALDKKAREILDKIEPNFNGDLKGKGNIPYTAIRQMIYTNVSMDGNILKRYKPWRQYNKFENGGEIDEIRSGAVVKWKGKDGVYDVIGTYEGTVTLREINPDPERDYKGSYKTDIKDLELVQKSTTPKDHISEYDMVLYKDIDGEFTKKGKVEKMYYQDGILLYKVEDAGSYTRDEIKKIK